MKFAGFELNTKRGELFYAGQRVPLQEQPLKLLELLLQSPGEIVGRARIREQLWGRAHIDHEHGINTAVRKLRKALAAHNAGQVSIATSSGRGYRLLLPKTNTLPSQLDPAGYEAYLTGRFLFSQRNPASLFAAKAKFELACERMPEFSLAHASLSRTCRFLTIFEVCEPGPLWEQAELHATRAVQLDASASEAQSSLACVLARYRWRWAEGCAVYQEALRLNPDDAETCCDYGVALLAMGKFDQGARCLDRVLGLDPRYAVGRATAALGWMMQGRQKEAVAMLTGMTEAMPGFLTPWIYLGIEQLNMERWQEAETSFRRTLTLAPENPTFVSLLAQAQAGQHRRKEAAASFGKLMALKATRYVSPTASALAAMAAGETEGALLAVEGVVTERDANFSLFRKMRAFDPIRQRPEFLATLAAMGLRNA